MKCLRLDDITGDLARAFFDDGREYMVMWNCPSVDGVGFRSKGFRSRWFRSPKRKAAVLSFWNERSGFKTTIKVTK